MVGSIKDFGGSAKDLARNPLGIIALFIVLVYGFAAVVTTLAGALTTAERLPLIYFLVLFPVLVLGVFAWLVSRHSNKLFGPADFKNEDNFVKMQLSAAVSLGAATEKAGALSSESDLQRVVDAVIDASPGKVRSRGGWRRHILWVDDHPENNLNERRAFEAMDVRFTLAQSTDEALQLLGRERFAVILSDMGRREGPDEGDRLLQAVRSRDATTPFFVYAGARAPELRHTILEHGGQGCTNNPQELFQLVTRALLQQSSA